ALLVPDAQHQSGIDVGTHADDASHAVRSVGTQLGFDAVASEVLSRLRQAFGEADVPMQVHDSGNDRLAGQVDYIRAGRRLELSRGANIPDFRSRDHDGDAVFRSASGAVDQIDVLQHGDLSRSF